MDLNTVGGLVNELLSAYDAALEYYTKWQRRKWQENRYRTHDKGKLWGSGSCGLSTSLSISGPIIRKAYTEAAETLGESFSAGDKSSCEALHENLGRLEQHIGTLYQAMTGDNGPLPLAEILRASEAVRVSTIATLADLGKRVRAARPTSLAYPASTVFAPTAAAAAAAARRRSSRMSIRPLSLLRASVAMPSTAPSVSEEPTEEEEGEGEKSAGAGVEDDVRTVYRLSGSSRSPFQSEPPSPPPTPKMVPGDRRSTSCTYTSSPSAAGTTSATTAVARRVSGSFGFGGSSSASSSSSSSSARPKASVLSAFCPEAMKYQIDVRKAMPPIEIGSESRSESKGHKGKGSSSSVSSRRRKCKCRCGYDWYGWLTTTTTTAADGSGNGDENPNLNLVVKDGFRMTPRFLGKSHCEGENGGFGCVLCTSGGRTATYADANALRDHINAAHTKWQMLHDLDMAGRCWGAVLS
ncbi:hypothetical protein SLS62_004998 [Diatrype stigma]|uniref:Uncharacterized protein n=1 Tax=Diatrype stigma TaxID=117547 RepID=A0AAN9YNU1_9PEZI